MPAGKDIGRLGAGAASGAASGAAAGPIGAAVGAGIGLLGSGLSLLGARRRRGQTEQLLASLRGSNVAQAESIAGRAGLSPGAQIRASGSVLSQLNARTDPMAAQLAQSETEAERRRRAVLFGGLGGSLAAAGQMVNLTGQAVQDAQDPLKEFYGQGMKPEGAINPMEAPATQGVMQQPGQANPMMQDLRGDFVQGVTGAMQQPATQTPLITDPNVAIPQTPLMEQQPTFENLPAQSRQIYEDVSGQQWRSSQPVPEAQESERRLQQEQMALQNRLQMSGRTEVLQQEQQSRLMQQIGTERNMVRRHQMLMRYLRMTAGTQ